MINKKIPFKSQIPVAPGETLVEAIDYLKISPASLAQRTHTTLVYVQGVLAGTVAVTPAFAEELTKIIDVPADFWLRYDADYWQLKAKEAARTPNKRGGNGD